MCFILDTFLNKMYLDRKKDDRYNLFRLKVDFPDTKEGREKREEYEERTRLPHYWVNSPPSYSDNIRRCVRITSL